MAEHMTTGVAVDCPCGATGVPMGWGGNGAEMKLYRHLVGLPYAGKSARGDKCGGPRDLFSHMLRESKLMLAGPGQRVMTRAEEAENDAFAAEFEQVFAESGQENPR